jgi:hypothetical protein
MPTHDMIDNRHEKLARHINRMPGSTESARFAVGYSSLSGLTAMLREGDGRRPASVAAGRWKAR